MTHLRIELNNILENVSNSIIKKLYDLASSGDLDNTSNLAGLIHTDITYRAYATYLTTMFPELTINSDAYAIPFEDPNMITYLNSIGVGSNGTVTEAQAAAATIVANSANTTVTKFNELRYFTSITSSKGGLSGVSEGYVRFLNWTALEEIDISNFTSLGHNNEYGYGDTFCGCTALKTVTASNKLEYIGCKGFYNCTNLEDITGLSGTIGLHKDAFNGCSKLKNSNFTNVEFVLNHQYAFYNCKLLTSISLSTLCIDIPRSTFEECSGLTTVTGLSNATTIGERCFLNCGALTNVDIDWSKITTIYAGGFLYSGLPGNISLPNITGLSERAFYGTKITSLTIGGSSITTIPFATCRDCTMLTTVSLPTSVTSIGQDAFKSCSSLASMSGLSNVTQIGTTAFEGCTFLTTLDITNNVSNVNAFAFSNCSNLSITWPSSSITFDAGERAFYNCENITFPLTLTISRSGNSTKLLRDCFAYCDLSNTDVILDSTITNLVNGAFYHTHAKSITANYLTKGGASMFEMVDATEIILPAYLGTVQSFDVTGFAFFAKCANLRKVVLGHLDSLPSNTTYAVDRGWFYQCPNMKYLDVGDSITTIECNHLSGNFYGYGGSMESFVIRNTTVPTLTITIANYNDYLHVIDNFGGSQVKIYVPDASLNDYKTATNWSIIASNIYPLSDLPSS